MQLIIIATQSLHHINTGLQRNNQLFTGYNSNANDNRERERGRERCNPAPLRTATNVRVTTMAMPQAILHRFCSFLRPYYTVFCSFLFYVDAALPWLLFLARPCGARALQLVQYHNTRLGECMQMSVTCDRPHVVTTKVSFCARGLHLFQARRVQHKHVPTNLQMITLGKFVISACRFRCNEWPLSMLIPDTCTCTASTIPASSLSNCTQLLTSSGALHEYYFNSC